MNKVLVYIIWLHFSPLRFNLHLRSSSSTFLHNELQYEIAITTPTTFLQIANVFHRMIFLQIAEHVFSKSPYTVSPNHRTCFLQIAEHVFLRIAEHVFSKSPNIFSPNRQHISPHVSPNHQIFFSKSPRYFADRRAAYVLLCSLRRRPNL